MKYKRGQKQQGSQYDAVLLLSLYFVLKAEAIERNTEAGYGGACRDNAMKNVTFTLLGVTELIQRAGAIASFSPPFRVLLTAWS